MPLGKAIAIAAGLADGNNHKNKPKVPTADEARQAFLQQKQSRSKGPSVASSDSSASKSSRSASEPEGAIIQKKGVGASGLDSRPVNELPDSESQKASIAELPANERRAELPAFSQKKRDDDRK